jgi:hypothetical protein
LAWLQHMHAELDAEFSSPDRFAATAREWLTGIMGEVFPELWKRLAARKESPGPAGSLPWVRPHPYSATVTVSAQDDRGDTLPGLDARARVVRDWWSPTWASFTFTAPAGYTGWPGSGPMQDCGQSSSRRRRHASARSQAA